MSDELEVQTELDRLVEPFPWDQEGARRETVVRVKYRRRGERRWRRLVLVPAEGVTLDETIEMAPEVCRQQLELFES